MESDSSRIKAKTGLEVLFSFPENPTSETAAAHPRAASCGVLRFKINQSSLGYLDIP